MQEIKVCKSVINDVRKKMILENYENGLKSPINKEKLINLIGNGDESELNKINLGIVKFKVYDNQRDNQNGEWHNSVDVRVLHIEKSFLKCKHNNFKNALYSFIAAPIQ